MVALLFDAEGVVIDTMRTVWFPADIAFLKKRACPFPEELKARITGSSMRDGTKIMQDYFGFGGDLDALVEERLVLVRERFEKKIDFVEGFRSFFATIHLHPAAIATSLSPSLLALAEKKLHLNKLFKGHLYTIYDVGGRSKPHPDIFLHAAAQLGTDPAEAIVFEDAPNGIEAAKRAGMRCVGITTSFPRERLTGADWVVDRFDQVDPSWLTSPNSNI